MFHELAMPPAQHPTDFIQRLRQGGIFFRVQRMRFPQDEQQDFDRIQFADRQAHAWEFIRARRETRRSHGLDAFD